MGAKRLGGGLGSLPVPDRNALARNPDLAGPPFGADLPGLRVDDLDPKFFEPLPTADKRPRARFVSGRLDRLALFQVRPADRDDPRWLAGALAGHHQGRFGEPIARQERLAAETTGRERLGEPIERLG